MVCLLTADEDLKLIRRAMDAVEAVTCIRFRYRTHQKDFVNIYSGRYCKSNLGRTGGAQEISLNKKRCMEKGIIIHELLHALGYIHMHSRPDRDKYVKINWQNILPQWFSEFNRVNPNIFMQLGTPYDYQSIMHYGSTAFTKNGLATIVPKNEQYLHTIGQRHGLSEGDINRINIKYKCHNSRSAFANHLYSSSESFTPSQSFGPHDAVFRPEHSYTKAFNKDFGFSKEYSFSKTKVDDDDDDLFNI